MDLDFLSMQRFVAANAPKCEDYLFVQKNREKAGQKFLKFRFDN